jgi:hypothetical protein
LGGIIGLRKVHVASVPASRSGEVGVEVVPAASPQLA